MLKTLEMVKRKHVGVELASTDSEWKQISLHKKQMKPVRDWEIPISTGHLTLFQETQ